MATCLASCGSSPSPTSPTVGGLNPPTRTILALGDSLTAGYGLAIEESYPAQLEAKLQSEGYNYRVQNAGISGDTSAQLLARLDWILEGDQTYDLAIVVIGANDAFQGIEPSVLEANLRTIITKLQAKNIPIFLAGMKSPRNLGIAYRAPFEALYEKVAEDMKVPRMDFFLDGVAAVSSLNQSDAIHPTKEGYALIVENLLTELQKYTLLQR